MAFFKIQNHIVNVQADKAGFKRVVLGDNKRAFSGKPLSSQKAIVNQWEFTTTWMTELNWRFLCALLNGEGHVWSFDSATDWAYSSKGLGPTSGTLANGSRYTTTTKFGAGALRVAAGSYLQFNVGYTVKWTVMVWHTTSYTHYIVNNAGEKWVDGVRNDAASTPFITETGGNIRIGDAASGSFQYFDDLVIIPEKINADWAEDFGTTTASFGPLPLLEVSGNFTWSDRFYAQCFDVNVKLSQGFVDGTWEPNLAQVSAIIHEDSRVT